MRDRWDGKSIDQIEFEIDRLDDQSLDRLSRGKSPRSLWQKLQEIPAALDCASTETIANAGMATIAGFGFLLVGIQAIGLTSGVWLPLTIDRAAYKYGQPEKKDIGTIVDINYDSEGNVLVKFDDGDKMWIRPRNLDKA